MIRPLKRGPDRLSTSIIILAAGQGTRMKSALPKVLQPLAGRPLLAHVIDCARAVGSDDVCVVYGHGGEDVRAAFADTDLRWALQAEQLGTGHALQQAMPDTPDDNRVVVLFGDVPLLTPETINTLLSRCNEDEVGLLTVELEEPFGYGRIIRDGNNVTAVVEERDATGSQKAIREINSGVACYPGRQLKDWLGKLKNDNSQGEYYLTDVAALAVEDGVSVRGILADSQDELCEAAFDIAKSVGGIGPHHYSETKNLKFSF